MVSFVNLAARIFLSTALSCTRRRLQLVRDRRHSHRVVLSLQKKKITDDLTRNLFPFPFSQALKMSASTEAAKEKMAEVVRADKIEDPQLRLKAVLWMEQRATCDLKQAQRGDGYFALLESRNKLPIRAAEFRSDFSEAWHDCRVLLLTGDTGCGKSTQIPQFVLHDMMVRNGDDLAGIACTQPYALSVVATADRVAEEMDVQGHGIVGYKYGGASSVDEETNSITYLTDEMLLEEIYQDPLAIENNYGVVIVDEAHHRTAAADILLSLLKQELLRPGSTLKVIIMSSIMDIGLFKGYFGACDGFRALPIEGSTPHDVVLKRSPNANGSLHEWTLRKVEAGLQNKRGSILVFVPGEEDVYQLEHSLLTDKTFEKCPEFRVLKLFAGQPQELQKLVGQSHPEPMVIVATSVAEAGITIPSVGLVVDCGLTKLTFWDPFCRCEEERLLPTSMSSVQQRMAKLGRTRPGKYYWLCEDSVYDRTEQYPPAEITRARLAREALGLLKARPELRLDTMDLPQPGPTKKQVEAAYHDLRMLQCVGDDGAINDFGKMALALECEPELALMMMAGSDAGKLTMRGSISLAAALSLPDPGQVLLLEHTKGDDNFQGDLDAYLTAVVRSLKRDFHPIEAESTKVTELKKQLSGLAVDFNRRLEAMGVRCENDEDDVAEIMAFVPALKLRVAAHSGRGDEYVDWMTGATVLIDKDSRLNPEKRRALPRGLDEIWVPLVLYHRKVRVDGKLYISHLFPIHVDDMRAFNPKFELP